MNDVDDPVPGRWLPESSEVKAAGGVVWRRGQAGIEVIVIHRPHRTDWSLPKGRVEPDEALVDTARREVEEETGYRCRVGVPVGVWTYIDHKGRTKAVWYWAMQIESGEATLNDEADEICWLDLAAAAARLDYDTDREVLTRFAALHAVEPTDGVTGGAGGA